MRNALFAAIAVLPLMSGAAFAGNEQPYEGTSMPIASAPTLNETNTDAIFQPGPSTRFYESRVATNQTGNERPAVFDGMLASQSQVFARN